MDRLRLTFLAAFIGMICVPAASGQTAANLTIVSGNGQIVCLTCLFNTQFQTFLPMVVKVTDANGHPIANKTVNWSVTLSLGQLSTLNSGATTQTDANGIASNTISQASLAGSALQGYLQTTVVAQADNASATFTETQALTGATNHLIQFVEAFVVAPLQGITLTGTAGAAGTSPVKVHVDASGAPVQGASVRLLNNNDPTTGATAVCQTGPGADTGSVLTDANGDANCTPVFGGIAGNGSVTVLVGGEDATPYSGTTAAIGYFQSFIIPISTTAAVPGSITISAGNGQSANPGRTLSGPLTVRVADASGVAAIAGVPVTWTVSPAGAATVNPATSTTDGQGLASTNVGLSTTTSGPVTIRAALAGANSNIFTTFNVNVVVIVSVTAIQKLSGDSQSAVAGATFAQPLAVVVSTNNGAPANIPVTFSISGPGNIGGQTSSTINTDSTGKAQVTVTAGSTTGTVTVTASTSGFNQSFSLTVIPPGPNLTANSFFNAAGLKQGSLSPCSLATISASGLAPGVQGSLNPVSLFGQLPTTLGPDSVTFNGVQAPILRVSNSAGGEQVIVQVPCEVTPGSSIPVTVNVGGGTATVNVAIQSASPGIFETVMSDGVRRAVMVRPDGSFVSLENPARRGEIIRVYVTGLGPTVPPRSHERHPDTRNRFDWFWGS